MILEFLIENFRSIDDEQVLGFFSTGAQGGLLGNTVPLANTPYRMVKCVGLYGANASGKTNVLRALWTLRQLICSSYRFAEDETIDYYEPCLFRSLKNDDPTRFEIELTIPVEGVERRFIYKISYTGKEIVSESLYVYSKTRKSSLFRRKRGETRESMNFGSSLKGGERKIAFFKNQAYLSVAGRNAGAPPVLRAVYQYFRTRFQQIRLFEGSRNPVGEEALAAGKLIRFVDVGVSDVERRPVDTSSIPDDLPANFPTKWRQQILSELSNRYVFMHESSANEKVEIDLRDESDGTQRLFAMLPRVADVLIHGGVFVIDEIESGMHPFMAEVLVRLFNDAEANVGQAQLIFTTHNSNLMSSNLLRRDQVWFTEKRDGRTKCYSLDDFDKKTVTPTSPYVRWYLEGRFGAVPSIDFASLVKAVVALRAEGGRDA